jgi:hypothetical protein
MKPSAAVVALRIVSLVSLLSLAASPAIAEENEKATISEYCASRNDLGLSHGACVAYFQTHNVVPHDASVCRDAGIRRLLGVENPGQCVKKLAALRE